MKIPKAVVLSLLVLCGSIVFSQTNNTCANATPFCTGQTMNFPAGVNAGVAQSGPNYGCLGSEPNPAWFFMQMANSGSMSISMAANNDIDFICWGPYPSLSGVCGSLSASYIQSCSYSASNTETCTIANAVAGQFYILLITNFSNQNQNITFNQNNVGNPGAATTNCGFVCVLTASASGVVCAGQTVSVSVGPGTSTAVNTYTWTGPNSFSSTAFTNVFTNIQSNQTYTVAGTSSAVVNGVPYNGTCQAVVTVSVVQYPTFSITPTYTTICQGGSFFASVTFTPASNPALYIHNWAPFSGAGVWQPAQNTTLISPLLLPSTTSLATVIYSVTVAPATTLVSCPVTKTLAVTINNPLTPTINIPPPQCDTFSALQLTATPAGGTWSGNPAVTPGGLLTPASAVNGTSSVSYGVSVGNCVVTNTQVISVSKYYTPALTSGLGAVCVQDPLFNLMNIAQSTLTGSWSGPQVSANQFNPAGLPTGTYNLTYSTTSLPDPTVCPASTVLVVSVFNPPTPTINPILPRCTNAGTVSLTANPPGGSWSGAAGLSPAGVQTPSANVIGVSTAIYTKGQGTCVATSSKTFHVSQFNPATLTGTVPHLCVTSNPVGLMSIVQNTNGSWSGVNVFANSFNPAGLATGIYTHSYITTSFPNAQLCPDTSFIAVSVLNPQLPNITQAGPFCSTAAPVQLSVTPAIGYWVSTSYLSSSGTYSPVLSAIGNNAVQYVIGTSTCNVQQTKIISTEAFVTAALNGSIQDQCTTGLPLDLSPISLSNLGSWSGPGIVGNTFNPAISGAGKFVLKYNTASFPSGLCPDKSTISVDVYSLALPSIAQAGPFCDNSLPVKLQVSPVGGIFGSGMVGAVSTGGLFNPALGIIGDNVISYSISSGPCVANAKTHILIEKFISADFTKQPSTAYCSNAQPFNLYSFVQNPGGTWSNGPGLVGTNMFDPSKANPGINTFTYSTYSSNTFPLLCPDSKVLTIVVKKPPVTTATTSLPDGCAPHEVRFSSPPEGSGTAYWSLGDGSAPQRGSGFTHLYNSPGSYTAVFSYEDNEAKGCSTQIVLPAINVYENPKADFTFTSDEITIANPEVTFINLSNRLANNRYSWTVSGLNERYEVHPSIYFPQIGTYRITLTATNVHNCRDQVTKYVEVKNDFSVFIPNSFTPNYDGLNDAFKPVFSLYGLDTETYNLEIYDRWGHIIFNTRDYTKGWDGTIQNKGEEPLKEDTYVYKLRYKDLNGQVYNKIGNVTLLK